MATSGEASLTAVLAKGTDRESRTRDQLAGLHNRYNLSRWQWTDRIQIDEGEAIPHSHPLLTLNTHELADDHRLLSVYLHEQLHWYTLTKPYGQDIVQREMDARYPDLPTALPMGCGSTWSNTIHLLICPLEFIAVAELIGEEEARRVVGQSPVYTAIYNLILRDEIAIRDLFTQHSYGP